MKLKAEYLTPSHVNRKVAVYQGESRIVGRLLEIRAVAGDSWRVATHVVRDATKLALVVGDIKLHVNLESEVEVLAA